ncbi:MAG: Hsp70 family protein, partial [Moheibacter sp.]
IEASSGLSDEDIERMKKEAEENASKDAEAKEKIEKINGADALIFQTEKQLKDFGEKLPADKKSDIEAALETLKTAHATQEIAQIDPAVEKLNEVWAAASQELYAAMNEQQAGADATEAQSSESSDTTTDSEVEDVDFEEVKE